MRFTFVTLAGLFALLGSTSARPFNHDFEEDAVAIHNALVDRDMAVCFINGKRFKPPPHYRENYNKCIAAIPEETLARAVCQSNLEGLGNWADEAFLTRQTVLQEKASASCKAAAAKELYRGLFEKLYKANKKCVVTFQKCEHKDRPDGLMACVEKVKHICLPQPPPPPPKPADNEPKNGTTEDQPTQNGTAPDVKPQDGTAAVTKRLLHNTLNPAADEEYVVIHHKRDSNAKDKAVSLIRRNDKRGSGSLFDFFFDDPRKGAEYDVDKSRDGKGLNFVDSVFLLADEIDGGGLCNGNPGDKDYCTHK